MNLDKKAEQHLLVKMYEDGFDHLTGLPDLLKKQSEYRENLRALIKTADGYQPRAWVEQYAAGLEKPVEDATLGDIARVIDPNAAKGFFPAGIAFSSLNEWRKSQGQEYQVYTATIDYGATGEGSTLMFAAARAYSAGEFHLWLAGRVSAYLAYGADLYKGLPPDTDRVANHFLTAEMRRLLQSEIDADEGGHIDVLFQQHINYS